MDNIDYKRKYEEILDAMNGGNQLIYARHPYPDNLLLDVQACCVQTELGPVVLKSKMPQDILGTIAYLLADMDKRTAEVLRLRYQQHKTVREIAHDVARTEERVQTLIAEGIATLRTPAALRMLEDGAAKFFAREAEGAYQCLAEKTENADTLHSGIMPTGHIYDAISSDAPIDDLDLSVRAWNCLKRAGIDTVGQLVQRDFESLLRVRNLGKKCAEEIKDKLTANGLRLKSMEDNAS